MAFRQLFVYNIVFIALIFYALLTSLRLSMVIFLYIFFFHFGMDRCTCRHFCARALAHPIAESQSPLVDKTSL